MSAIGRSLHIVTSRPSPHARSAWRRGVAGGGCCGSYSACLRAELAERPPTPDPSPPLRGGRGEDRDDCSASSRFSRATIALTLRLKETVGGLLRGALFGCGRLQPLDLGGHQRDPLGELLDRQQR